MRSAVIGLLIGLALMGCRIQETEPDEKVIRTSYAGPDSVGCFIPPNQTVTDSGVVYFAFERPETIVSFKSSDSLLVVGAGPRSLTFFGKEGSVRITAQYHSSERTVVFVLKHANGVSSSPSPL